MLFELPDLVLKQLLNYCDLKTLLTLKSLRSSKIPVVIDSIIASKMINHKFTYLFYKNEAAKILRALHSYDVHMFELIGESDVVLGFVSKLDDTFSYFNKKNNRFITTGLQLHPNSCHFVLTNKLFILDYENNKLSCYKILETSEFVWETDVVFGVILWCRSIHNNCVIAFCKEDNCFYTHVITFHETYYGQWKYQSNNCFIERNNIYLSAVMSDITAFNDKLPFYKKYQCGSDIYYLKGLRIMIYDNNNEITSTVIPCAIILNESIRKTFLDIESQKLLTLNTLPKLPNEFPLFNITINIKYSRLKNHIMTFLESKVHRQVFVHEIANVNHILKETYKISDVLIIEYRMGKILRYLVKFSGTSNTFLLLTFNLHL